MRKLKPLTLEERKENDGLLAIAAIEDKQKTLERRFFDPERAAKLLCDFALDAPTYPYSPSLHVLRSQIETMAAQLVEKTCLSLAEIKDLIVMVSHP